MFKEEVLLTPFMEGVKVLKAFAPDAIDAITRYLRESFIFSMQIVQQMM